MNSLDDSGAIFEYHRDMIALHGMNDSKALGWLDHHSQLIRFEALSRIADLNDYTVLDAGCGYGDLFAYLVKKYPSITYWGVEQIPELIAVAEARYGSNVNATFLSGNFLNGKLPVSDYIFASGSLNYRSQDTDLIFKTIKRLFESCKIGLGFNLLNHIAGNGLITAYNYEIILEYCQSLTKDIRYINDYDQDDYTFFLYH